MDSFGFIAQHFRLWITQPDIGICNHFKFIRIRPSIFEIFVWIRVRAFPLLLLLWSSPLSQV